MRNIKSFATIIALANFAVAIWHLYLVEKLHPAAPIAESVYIAAFAGALTLAGVALVWMRRQKSGLLVLIAVFTIGLVVGSSEHFFITGPNNVFEVGNDAGPCCSRSASRFLFCSRSRVCRSPGACLLTRS